MGHSSALLYSSSRYAAQHCSLSLSFLRNTWNFRLQNYVCNTLPIIISTMYGVGGVVKLTTPYFSHSSHYRVSSIQCFPMQHTQILLQYAMLTKLKHVHIKFNKI